MRRWARARRTGHGDAGFTLTELVIAMVVLGVIASIAITSFLGSRNNSYDKEAQSSIEVVASSVSSTSSRTVSVQAFQTWDSTGGLLGCQGSYAVAFSSSGSCWVARIIREGKFLAFGGMGDCLIL